MTQYELMALLREAPNLYVLRHVALTRLVSLVERLSQLSLRDRTIFIGRTQGTTLADLGAQLGLPESEVAAILTRIVTELAEDNFSSSQ